MNDYWTFIRCWGGKADKFSIDITFFGCLLNVRRDMDMKEGTDIMWHLTSVVKDSERRQVWSSHGNVWWEVTKVSAMRVNHGEAIISLAFLVRARASWTSWTRLYCALGRSCVLQDISNQSTEFLTEHAPPAFAQISSRISRVVHFAHHFVRSQTGQHVQSAHNSFWNSGAQGPFVELGSVRSCCTFA